MFYQARRVSGHMCVLGLQCFRPGGSYVCVRIESEWSHTCVLGLQCFTRPGE